MASKIRICKIHKIGGHTRNTRRRATGGFKTAILRLKAAQTRVYGLPNMCIMVLAAMPNLANTRNIHVLLISLLQPILT